jgi:repressor LexA
MEEQPNETTVRPTKKQRELLSFIEEFIVAHGYSPSYREIMKGLGYTSVATVSLHINNLIKRGHLRKRDRSARSLELTQPIESAQPKVLPKQLKASEEKWLVEKIELYFSDAEKSATVSEREVDQLYVLCGALKVLGLEGAANAFIARLSEIKKKIAEGHYSA